MKKNILLALGVAAVMTACSQEEVLDINNEANAIKVGVDVNGASRASDSYCPEVLPQGFNLSAVTADGKIYFLNDLMRKKSLNGNMYYFVNGTRYWADSALDFYAWHCTQTGVNFQLTKNEEGNYQASFVDFKVADEAKDQADLIYAKYSNVSVGGQVDLTFHHALSQVAFKAKCENATINIDIKGVGLYGIYNQGTFTWDQDTKNNILAGAGQSIIGQGDQNNLNGSLTPGTGISNGGENGEGGEEGEDQTIACEWTVNEGAPTTSYFVTLPETKTINSESGTVVLTGAPDNHTNKAGWANVFQVLPQSYAQDVTSEIVPSIPTDPADEMLSRMIIRHNIAALGGKYYGIPRLSSIAYIMLQCEITTTNANGETIVLYGATNAEGQPQYVYIPIQFAWLPGYRYIYTINFAANGSGGITEPNPGTDPENPVDPVLKKIIVSGTVVEYNEDESDSNYVTADQNTQGVLNLLQ